MSAADRERVAGLLESAAAELDRAAAHLRTAAGHFRTGEIPRGCAHAFAAEGHVAEADRSTKEASRMHASRATP